jgi:hypothetical protein
MFELAADLTLPSLLSITGLLSGKIIERIEVVDVEFDEQIDEGIFDCQPLAGQSIRSAEPVIQRVTLDSAIAKVPFKLLLPTRGVGGGNPDLHYKPGKNDGAGDMSVIRLIGVNFPILITCLTK